MGIPGEVLVVDDVPVAFADLFLEVEPDSVALSGGEVARDCYTTLAGAPYDWSHVDVFFSDERFVPLDHPDSNGGMARAVLLERVHPRAVHSMYEPKPIEIAATEYDARVRRAPPIDLVHLGMGADGHTASLFPGSLALDERERLVVATGDDAHPHPRLTFTFPAIARARVVVVAVRGEAKREALARIRAGEDLPASCIRAERVIWLVDPAALGSDSANQ
ncbi:MAG: 6-phosphogluconolactonase [Actinomycetota bacterium]